MFVEDRALQSFDKAVGPRMSRLGARVSDADFPTGLVERGSVLAALIGEDALNPPTGPPIERDEGVLEEVRGLLGIGCPDDASGGQGAGRIAGGKLPDLADTLELADVEAIEAHEIPGFLGLDVPTATTGRIESAPCSLGEQPRSLGAVVLEHGQALPPGAKARTPKGSVDRTRREGAPGAGELQSDPVGSPRRPGEGQSEDGSFVVRLDLRRTAPRGPSTSGMQAVGAIALKPFSPAVIERSRDAQLCACSAGVSKFFRSTQDIETKIVYLILEGHRDTSKSLT
jgi:hypothetical protein